MSRKLPHLFDFKSGHVDLLHFELHSSHLQQIEQELQNRLKETPDFFANDPIVIDIRFLQDWKNLNFPILKDLLKKFKIKALATIVNKQQYEWATVNGFSAIIESKSRRSLNQPKNSHISHTSHSDNLEWSMNNENVSDQPLAQQSVNLNLFDNYPIFESQIQSINQDLAIEKNPEKNSLNSLSNDMDLSIVESQVSQKNQMKTLFVDKPMRSGQRIYAAGNVVVLGVVNHGAEIIAEGDIHIYAPLRGRALAGVKGNNSARIFCTCLDPELISIAGIYRTAENRLPDDIRNCASQVKLVGETLFFEPLAMN